MNEILNVGICTVDVIARTVDEFPPRGGLRLFDDLTLTTGGNAVNCSIALAKMGLSCDLIIKVGDDIFGKFVLSEAKKHGIGVEGVIRESGTSTPFTFVCVHSDGQRSFIHTMGTNATMCFNDVNLQMVRQARFCFFTGTMVMATIDGEQTGRLLREAQQAGVTTLLDTVYTDAASQVRWREVIHPCLPHLDYFIPSEPEAKAISGEDKPSDMARYFQDRGCRNAVIKLGREGAFCRDVLGGECHTRAYLVEAVVDTTGAGDCWSAGFLAGLREGSSIADAAALGNAVAAHCIKAPGASTGVGPLKKIREFQTVTPFET